MPMDGGDPVRLTDDVGGGRFDWTPDGRESLYTRQDTSGLREIHEVRSRYFSPPYPTSTLVAVSGFVNPDALIEINAVAAFR